ncbi:hypothetical protein [Ereboglobus luteus]|nr:hypothetical protein [Ereboglobus luteus]
MLPIGCVHDKSKEPEARGVGSVPDENNYHDILSFKNITIDNNRLHKSIHGEHDEFPPKQIEVNWSINDLQDVINKSAQVPDKHILAIYLSDDGGLMVGTSHIKKYDIRTAEGQNITLVYKNNEWAINDVRNYNNNQYDNIVSDEKSDIALQNSENANWYINDLKSAIDKTGISHKRIVEISLLNCFTLKVVTTGPGRVKFLGGHGRVVTLICKDGKWGATNISIWDS